MEEFSGDREEVHQTWWEKIYPTHGIPIKILNAHLRAICDAVLYTALILLKTGMHLTADLDGQSFHATRT
jgi:hypothetical protein